MRALLVFATAALWVGAAAAQTDPPASQGSSIETAPPQALAPASTSTGATAPQAATAQQTTDQQMICRTVQAAAESRLARHAVRMCKTREQWDALTHRSPAPASNDASSAYN
jgi:hypothetical protein